MNAPSRDRSLDGRRFLVVVGGTHDRDRGGEAGAGRKPRNEISELEARAGADVIDFVWLSDPGAPLSRRVLTWIANRTGRWSEMLSVAWFLHARSYDVVYATGEDVAIAGSVLSRMAFWRRQTLVVRIEDPHRGTSRIERSIYDRLLRLALHRIDVTLCRTVIFEADLRSMVRRRPDRVETAEQEVDEDFYSAESDEADLAVVPAERYILSGGLEMRDYPTLLEAVLGLDVALVIGAGSPWSRDAFEVDEVPEGVIVGKFSHLEMRELYRNCALVAVATKPTNRTCGISVIAEAWSMGRPVVAATVGLADAVVEAGSIAVAAGDVDGLRAGIEALLVDPGRGEAVGVQGRRYVESRLSLDDFVDRVLGAQRTA